MDKLTIKTNHPEDLTIDSEVSTTTSEFEYDAVTGEFDNNLSTTAEVEVEHIAEDYSEYVQGKACNGGCYGYDYYRVLRVININTRDVETVPEAIIDEDYHVEDILYEIPLEDE